MNNLEFVKNLYQIVVKEDLTLYEDLFVNTEIKDATDPYWKDALNFYAELTDDNKKMLFKIIEQVQVDTVSTVLGILDGTVTLTEDDYEIEMKINGEEELLNGDLQDLFLEYVEENE
ncbi:transposase [Bacillus sp. AFS096315]|uniref:transposase n=1 Tax=Bacillus sp. AFS096315 TaxID=2033517 RepID=UPI000BED377B|nr:transposase [Bacillus sp. AFS096315]PEC49626.1 transposase [Bacillus sp. AFS096315]